jgi:hypothetical protein
VRAQYREDELVPENAHLAGKAQTVLGPIEPEHLGIELMHEHARRFGQFGRRLPEMGEQSDLPINAGLQVAPSAA